MNIILRLVRLQRTVGQIVVWQQDHSDKEVKLQVYTVGQIIFL